MVTCFVAVLNAPLIIRYRFSGRLTIQAIEQRPTLEAPLSDSCQPQVNVTSARGRHTAGRHGIRNETILAARSVCTSTDSRPITAAPHKLHRFLCTNPQSNAAEKHTYECMSLPKYSVDGFFKASMAGFCTAQSCV